MHIILVTLTFPPEPAEQLIDLCVYLESRGHSVTVITSLPSYPHGKIYQDYQGKIWCSEVINNVKVIRLPVFPSQSSSSYLRLLYYMSNALASLLPVLISKGDVVIGYFPPASIGLPVLLRKFIRGTPYVCWINDMWPDILVEVGVSDKITKHISRLLNVVYKYSSKIVVLSSGFKNNLMDKGVLKEKVHIVHNWVDPSLFKPVPVKNDEFHRYGLNPSDFLVFYAGSQGKMQKLDKVILAMKQLREYEDIKFVLMGVGTEHNKLKSLVTKERLSDKVIFLGRVPNDQVRLCYSFAKAFIVHLTNSDMNKLTIPHKIYGYMAAGRPIIAAVDGCARKEVLDANAGIACNPEDQEGIANAIFSLYNLNRDSAMIMGNNGSSFVKKHRNINSQGAKLEEILLGVS